MTDQIWEEIIGEGPLVALAVHDGHAVRESLIRRMSIDDASRLREEDPFTAWWTSVAPTRVIGCRSRFEVDLNRPRDKAVYVSPADAWGLKVWSEPLPPKSIEKSLAEYDAFYARLREIFDEKVETHGHFVVLDLHSYNHRRSGPEGPLAPEGENPQVNIGTGTMDRTRWSSVVDRFIADLTAFDFPGAPLDVRENVRFRGGNIPKWIHENYPETGCALAVEFKKFFMDEWTGEPNATLVDAIGSALAWTAQGLVEEMAQSRAHD